MITALRSTYGGDVAQAAMTIQQIEQLGYRIVQSQSLTHHD